MSQPLFLSMTRAIYIARYIVPVMNSYSAGIIAFKSEKINLLIHPLAKTLINSTINPEAQRIGLISK